MAVRRIADPTETIGYADLIREGAYRQALTEIVGSELGKDIGEYCFAMLGDRPLAEEALLDTWVALYGAMPFLADTPLRPWIFDCARQQCNRREAANGLEDIPLSSHSPSSPQHLRNRMSELQEEERDAVLLRYLGRLDYHDVADICGLDTATARKLAGKALLRLRQAELGEPTTATSASAVMPNPIHGLAPTAGKHWRRTGR